MKPQLDDPLIREATGNTSGAAVFLVTFPATWKNTLNSYPKVRQGLSRWGRRNLCRVDDGF